MGIVEAKVKLIKEEVKPWVDRWIRDDIQNI